MKLKNFAYIIAAGLLAACSSDDPVEETVWPDMQPDSYYLGFTVKNLPAGDSRGAFNPGPGGTYWGDAYDNLSHTDFETYINPDQLWVAFYAWRLNAEGQDDTGRGDRGKIIGLCHPVGLTADGRPAGPGQKIERFHGVVEIFDPEYMSEWNATRVVVYTNTPFTRANFIDDNGDKVNPDARYYLSPDYDSRGNSIRDVYSTKALGQPHVDGLPDGEFVCESIPAWGITTIDLGAMKKGKVFDIGTVDMLPAVAKHTVRFAPGLHGDPRITSVTMSYVEHACRVTPTLVFPNNDRNNPPVRDTKSLPINCMWNDHGASNSSLTVSNLNGDGSITWYTPDIGNSAGGMWEDGTYGNQVRLELHYVESGSNRTAVLYYRPYKDGHIIPETGEDKIWHIVRNHYYDFEITAVGTDFKVNATIAPWNDGGSYEIN